MILGRKSEGNALRRGAAVVERWLIASRKSKLDVKGVTYIELTDRAGQALSASGIKLVLELLSLCTCGELR